MKWLEKNWPNSALVEIKIKGNKLLPHQEVALRHVANKAFSFKIPDTGKRNPADAFLLKNADALLITYVKRGTIEIENFRTGEKKLFNISTVIV